MNRSLYGVIVLLLLTGLLSGCPAPAPEETGSEEAVTEAAPLPEQVQKAVDIAKAMEADPDRAAAILEEAVMTVEEYEALLYDIAADPELSRLYNQAMGF